MEVALRTPKRANDDSKFVEFLSIHIFNIKPSYTKGGGGGGQVDPLSSFLDNFR